MTACEAPCGTYNGCFELITTVNTYYSQRGCGPCGPYNCSYAGPAYQLVYAVPYTMTRQFYDSVSYGQPTCYRKCC